MSSRVLQKELVDKQASPWPHRWAWILACGVFPLIWMGGLVTTCGAGMSVPDWPTTYRSWFYPLDKWLWNFNDLFLEHSHRTIAQIDGIVAIILIVSVWRWESRKSVRWLAAAILLGLILQGVLGGLRVVLDQRVLARIHGCAAPLVFALCTAMVSFTSAAWRKNKTIAAAMLAKRAKQDGKHESSNDMPRANVGMAPASSASVGMASVHEYPSARSVQWLGLAMCCGLYAEIVLGAQFRHPLLDVAPILSLVLLWLKVNIAAFLVVGISYLLFIVLQDLRQLSLLVRRVKLLAMLYFLQLVLAGVTWVSNFGWPKWFTDNIAAMNYTVVQNGRLQVWATTAHAAVGSLCFVAALSVALWSYQRMKDENN